MALTTNQVVTAQSITGGTANLFAAQRAVASSSSAYRFYGKVDTGTSDSPHLTGNQSSRLRLYVLPYSESITGAQAFDRGRRAAKLFEIPWPDGNSILVFKTPPIAALSAYVYFWFETPGVAADTLGVLDLWFEETSLACTGITL